MTAAISTTVIAFLLMEPVTYLVHRYVMHGLGRRLHRSHHRRWPRRSEGEGFLESNDVFPVLFGTATMVVLAVGFNVRGLSLLVPVCVGATLYGAAYAFVHDVYIHQRLPVRWRHRHLDRLGDAHALHHRFGGEPYGMLWPVVPAAVRARGRRGSGERVGAVPGP